MQGIKTVRFEEVESMMEQMMSTPIFTGAEKREILNISGNLSDPNLTMDLRHKTIDEPIPDSVRKRAVLAEVTRLIMDEESRILYRKQEQALLEDELKKFEKRLSSSRPRFRGPYTCGKRKIFESFENYDELWKMAPRRIKVRIKDSSKSLDSQVDKNNFENSGPVETIKVTIKDKPSSGSKKQDEELLRMGFEILMNYAREKRRLREIKLKIQENLTMRRMRNFFEAWKTRAEKSKTLAAKRRQEYEISDDRKIEMFVNAINEKQKKIAKKSVAKELIKARENHEVDEMKKSVSDQKNSPGRTKNIHVVESPSQNRLNAQKKIIAEQRMKLAEQNRIIEELRLKKIEDDAKRAGKETITVAKEALVHCGHRTRRTLMQLMREEGYRDKKLLEPPRIPSPPRFLARMEARAEARRERVRRAEEERKRKLEEQRLKEETAKREEEENRKRLQLEAQREARRIRIEQEKKRARELERSRLTNEMADRFYRKYLMRRYIMDPLVLLVDLKHNYAKIANEHYNRSLLKKSLDAWQTEANNQRDVKLELSLGVWRRNLLWYVFKNWLEATKAESRKGQVAVDFYELRLQDKCLKFWSRLAIESKIREAENLRLADSHSEMRLKLGCFRRWRKYLKISEDVKESDRRREMWRELVQRVVPDFDPKQRGVIIDD